MCTKSRVGAIVASLVGSALTVAVVCAAAGKDVKDDEKLTKLYVERVELAEKGYRVCVASYKAGTITLDLVVAASRELAEANLPLCKTTAERIAIRDKQVARAKDLESAIKALNKVNARGGELSKFFMAGSERVKAEIGLELEKRESAGAAK